MTIEQTELELIPPPAKKLTRAVALKWLSEESDRYVAVVAHGLEVPSRQHRKSYAILADNLAMMLIACARVVQTGKAERLMALHELDAKWLPDVLRQLAEIVQTRSTDPDNAGVCAFDALSERLLSLLGEREAA